jgi:competence protein ComFC
MFLVYSPSMLLDLLFPKRCVSCEKWGAYLCQDCTAQIKFFEFSICAVCDRPTENGRTHDVCSHPLDLDGFIPFAQYAEPISLLTKSIKYGYISDAAKQTYELTKNRWPSFAPQFDAFVPVPIHPHKEAERGFNQAVLLAKNLSRHTNIPVNTRALIKVRETISQASLKLKDRKLNLQQGFVCLHPNDIKGKIIAVVDDVATTRTTLRLAGVALKKAGAKEVWGVVLAHAF